MPDTNVIPIDQVSEYKHSQYGSGTGEFRHRGTYSGGRQVSRARSLVDRSFGDSSVRLPIDTLYPEDQATRQDLVKALAQLQTAVDLLGHARNESDILKSDRFVQRFQALLPELFKWRTVGDGYGAIVNSLHFGFINQRGIPLKPPQLNAVWRILKELRTRPFMTLEQAISYIDELTKVGVGVDPPILSDLISDPSDQDE